MEEKLQKDYPWLYTKKITKVENGKRVYKKVDLNPIITDCESHWSVVREKDASPLILSKNYG